MGSVADGEDQAVEAALRPKDLNEFIGQEKVREQLDLVLGIDLAGGTSITLAAVPEAGQESAINPTDMATAVSIMERSVNGLGVSEAEVQTQGDRNIIVNIPKGTNSEQAREQVGTTANFTSARSSPPNSPRAEPLPRRAAPVKPPPRVPRATRPPTARARRPRAGLPRRGPRPPPPARRPTPPPRAVRSPRR
ncbi:Protein translocase subunit SecD [Streptomyces hirsutus]